MEITHASADAHITELLSSDQAIRYIALYINGSLVSRERPGLFNTSASESDKYEELIVNPTLLKLVQQRGNIDCGGMNYVLIRYGNFFQYVQPLEGGHISVGIRADSEVMRTVEGIQNYLVAP